MRIALKIVLVILGIVFLLISGFIIAIMRSRPDNDKEKYRRLQTDNAIWLTVFLVLAAASIWGAVRI